MTVSSTTTRNTYAGDASSVEFDYTFRILESSHVAVLVVASDGSVTVKTETTDYTVSGVGDSGGGTVTFVTAPGATDTVILKRAIPIKQETDYVENDTFPAETHEDALDKITMIVQQLQEEVDRCIKFPDNNVVTDAEISTAELVAEYVFRVNAAGTDIETKDVNTILDEAIDDLTALSTTADGANDLLLVYDASSSTFKKITVNNISAGLAGGASVIAGTGISVLESGGDFTVSTNDGAIDHDALLNFVANEHIDWTSTTENLSTSGTAATGALGVTGNITVTGTVDGRDVATDGTKLDGVEALADVTDETNVTDALDGATLTAATVATGDKVLIQDADDSDILKTVTAQSIADLGGGGDTLPVVDTTSLVEDPVDGSREMRIDVGAVSTATIRTLTMPDQDVDLTPGTGTFISDSSTNTLTNKTINTASNTLTIVEADISDLGSYITASSTDTLTNKTFDANGTGNSLSNVDVADLANGTDGELITWDAAGAPATVAVGTAGQVLTSNGVGAAPTFQAGGGGGAWTYVSTATASASATIEFNNLTAAAYMIVMRQVLPASDANTFKLRLSNDNGVSFIDVDYQANRALVDSSGGGILVSSGPSATYIQLTISSHLGSAGSGSNEYGFSGVMILSNTSNASGPAYVYTRVNYQDVDGDLVCGVVDGISADDAAGGASTDIDAIEFAMTSGNIASGIFDLYSLTTS